MNEDTTKKAVREKYGSIAIKVKQAKKPCCCGGASTESCDPISSNLYDPAQIAKLPTEAVAASLGCGNPTALAELKPGEIVLDLGSGGGIDVFLAAKQVGPTGKAYGVDMTDEMLALARDNQKKVGLNNVEFLKGELEHLPLPDRTVDVIISNCVVNLSPDKDQVLAEAFRVLKPGGRVAISDIVTRGEIPPQLKKDVELWAGCVAGALEESVFKEKLTRAGFTGISVEATRVYRAEDVSKWLTKAQLDIKMISPLVDGKFISAFIRATKPA